MNSFAEMSFSEVVTYIEEEVTHSKLAMINDDQFTRLVVKLQNAGQVLDYYFWFLVNQADMNSH